MKMHTDGTRVYFTIEGLTTGSRGIALSEIADALQSAALNGNCIIDGFDSFDYEVGPSGILYINTEANDP
jgi:hypothetical protein